MVRGCVWFDMQQTLRVSVRVHWDVHKDGACMFAGVGHGKVSSCRDDVTSQRRWQPYGQAMHSHIIPSHG